MTTTVELLQQWPIEVPSAAGKYTQYTHALQLNRTALCTVAILTDEGRLAYWFIKVASIISVHERQKKLMLLPCLMEHISHGPHLESHICTVIC